MHYPDDSVFVAGASKVSKDDVISNVHQSFSLCLVIDIHSNRILNASCTMALPETVDFVRGILVGKNIVTDIDEIAAVMKKRFLALSQKALLAALHDAQNRYLMAYPQEKTEQ